MKKLFLFFVLMIITGSIFAQDQSSLSSDQIIIRFRNGITFNNDFSQNLQTGIADVDRIVSEYDALNIRQLNTGKKSLYSAVVIKFATNAHFEKILEELNKISTVEYAEPDFIGYGSGERGFTPNDQYYTRQWGLKNDGSFTAYPAVAGADIQMEDGWAIEQGDSTVIVGVLDTGCKLNHPELLNRIWKNYDEIPGNGIDEDNNNYIDDVQGWDYAYNDNNPTDDYGHGTNVTGIIGASGNNSIGYAGVDWNCKLMILKVLNSQNWGYYSWWSDALHYAVDNGAKVINMSLGGTDISSLLNDAVSYALESDVTIVACMMNTNSNTVYYPAAYPGVIAVGSTNPDDKRSHPFFWNPTSGSNYGSHISVIAPGNYIYGLDYQSNTNYGYYWGGTSQATPLVSGLSALLLAQNPSMTPAQIKSLIETTAEDQVGDPLEDTPGWDQYYGFGRINAYNALLLVSGITGSKTSDKGLTIYPNPNYGIVNIALPYPPKGKAIATITNYLGQIVFSEELRNQEFTIRISPLPGMYILTVKDGNTVLSGKFIIR